MMRFKTLVFLAFALLFTVGLGFSLVWSIRLGAYRETSSRQESILAEALTRARGVDSAGDKLALYEAALVELSREQAFTRAFRNEAVVRSLRSLVAYFLLQGFLTMLVFALTIRWLTSGLDRLATSARLGQPFGRSRVREFSALADSLNSMLVQLEHQRRQLAEQAKLAAWKEVASYLSHQLKNPLAAIALCARNGEDVLADPAANTQSLELSRDCFGAIREEAGRMNAIIQRLRDLASFESLQPQSVRLGELLDEALSKIRKRCCTVERQGDFTAKVRVDRVLLAQALRNLLDNAMEAAGAWAEGNNVVPKMSPLVLVRVEDRPAGLLAILVEDNAASTNDAILTRMARDRFTTKEHGSGLGLVFVSRVVALCDGTLEINRSALGGASVAIVVPRESDT